VSAARNGGRNRLGEATSPYLLQHAENPVDWFPWGEAALNTAREQDKPILLSIGYSACHWCHVMAHESFEDAEIGAQMSRDFVCIKVDREERPDIDEIYMAATLAMNDGQGGWPMTVFLTPDQEPFFAGTYFPPDDQHGRPGFKSLLTRIANAWRGDRATLLRQGARLVEHLRENAQAAPGLSLGEDELRTALDQLRSSYDERHGGFGGAPKFPPAVTLQLLLRLHRRFGEEHALAMVEGTLKSMAAGGMYDQVGGGFHRYSVDERWLVPHFEKMLYDNALLAKTYLEGFVATGNAEYRRVTDDILSYVLREMTSPQGAFYSATDADSEGEEGRFFVWTREQVEAVLDEETARRFCEHYDVTESGNWEGNSIPNTPQPIEASAARLGIPGADLQASLEKARGLLYEERSKRVAPGLDDKLLTGWNGLMIGAFAEAFRSLRNRRYLDAATRAADFVLAELRDADGRLLRTHRAGKSHTSAHLEDYAYLSEGLLDLYEAGGDFSYFEAALELAERVRSEFAAPEGGFFTTATSHEKLIVRHREGHDGATPSPNSVMALVLARLSAHTGRDDLRDDAGNALRAWARAVERQPRAFSMGLIAVDWLLRGPVELAFVGGEDDATEALWQAVGSRFLPHRVVAHWNPDEPRPALPLLEGKELVKDRPALYVCRDFGCRRPVTDPGDVAHELHEAPLGEERTSLSVPRIAGRATTEATAAYATRHGAGFGTLGGTGLTCGRFGFGGYRVDDATPEHREALTRALLGGVNLIDTSTNYMDGGSERLIGEVVASLASEATVARDEIIVVSKAGYVQGENLTRAKHRDESGRAFPEMIRFEEGLWHCIHPAFLEDQLERSLERLRLESLDVLLLHNPEYFLMDGARRNEGDLAGRRDEFYRRLTDSFDFLEEQIRSGRLGCYGVSSNTAAAAPDDPIATSLTRMLESARAAGGNDHGFRVLQLPMNLLETGAAAVRNNGDAATQTVLEHAVEHAVGILVNRPLNASGERALVRLASFEVGEPIVDLQEQLAVVGQLEREFDEQIGSRLRSAEGKGARGVFAWSSELPPLLQQVQGYPHWEEIESTRVFPRLSRSLEAIGRGVGGGLAASFFDWRNRYVNELQKLFDEAGRQAREKSNRASVQVREGVDDRLPEKRRDEPLSRKSLWIVASTPGVSCVLLGMRRPAYVEDALAIRGWDPLPDAKSVLARAGGPK